MNDIMTIRRSSEKGMYLLREGDCLWRVNKDGMVDCIASGHIRIFELLTKIQQWKALSRGLFLNHPLQESSD